MTIGHRIRIAREQANLSLSEAGGRIGATKQQWHQWEIGVHSPRYDKLEHISGALNLTVRQLLEIGIDGEKAEVA